MNITDLTEIKETLLKTKGKGYRHMKFPKNYAPDVKERVQLMTVEINPQMLCHMSKTTDKVRLAALNGSQLVFRYIKNPSDSLMREVATRFPHCIRSSHKLVYKNMALRATYTSGNHLNPKEHWAYKAMVERDMWALSLKVSVPEKVQKEMFALHPMRAYEFIPVVYDMVEICRKHTCLLSQLKSHDITPKTIQMMKEHGCNTNWIPYDDVNRCIKEDPWVVMCLDYSNLDTYQKHLAIKLKPEIGLSMSEYGIVLGLYSNFTEIVEADAKRRNLDVQASVEKLTEVDMQIQAIMGYQYENLHSLSDFVVEKCKNIPNDVLIQLIKPNQYKLCDGKFNDYETMQLINRDSNFVHELDNPSLTVQKYILKECPWSLLCKRNITWVHKSVKVELLTAINIFEKLTKSGDCSVCCVTKPLVKTACNHEFCASCMTKWVLENGKVTCPMCRSFLDPREG